MDESHLSRALAEIRANQVDDADLYFQYTRAEGWSLEEGIVRPARSPSTRAWACVPSAVKKPRSPIRDDISEASLLDAARAVRAISGAQQQRKVRIPKTTIAPSRTLYPGVDPIAT